MTVLATSLLKELEANRVRFKEIHKGKRLTCIPVSGALQFLKAL
jgi:hypothetical protein